MDWPSFLTGLFIAGLMFTMFRRNKKPAAVIAPAVGKTKLPDREVGDVVMHLRSKLPVLLLEELSHNNFRACFITPKADIIGATVGNDLKPTKELEDILAKEVNDRDVWPDYPHELSDKEHANYAQAMLQEQK